MITWISNGGRTFRNSPDHPAAGAFRSGRRGTLTHAIAPATGRGSGSVFHQVELAPVEVRRSALIASSAASTFDLIEAAEHYPSFLPWCTNAVILARDDSVVSARLTINYHGLRFDLTTRNPKRPPHWMAVHLERGPFRRFEGEWRVVELAAEACKIEFTLRYEFDHAFVGRLAGGVFDGIANTMVDAFAQRAATAPVAQERSDDHRSFPIPGRTS
jgi:ribosome-associated toxin RatA of RatAB toxin-antitoxin module